MPQAQLTPEQQKAFLAGAYRFGKKAGFDALDQAALQTLMSKEAWNFNILKPLANAGSKVWSGARQVAPYAGAAAVGAGMSANLGSYSPVEWAKRHVLPTWAGGYNEAQNAMFSARDRSQVAQQRAGELREQQGAKQMQLDSELQAAQQELRNDPKNPQKLVAFQMAQNAKNHEMERLKANQADYDKATGGGDKLTGSQALMERHLDTLKTLITQGTPPETAVRIIASSQLHGGLLPKEVKDLTDIGNEHLDEWRGAGAEKAMAPLRKPKPVQTPAPTPAPTAAVTTPTTAPVQPPATTKPAAPVAAPAAPTQPAPNLGFDPKVGTPPAVPGAPVSLGATQKQSACQPLRAFAHLSGTR